MEKTGKKRPWKSKNDFHFSHSFNNNKLDDRDHFLQNPNARVASLRGLIGFIPEQRSASERNAYRLHRNPHRVADAQNVAVASHNPVSRLLFTGVPFTETVSVDQFRGFTPRDFQRFAADMAVNSESFAVAASLFPILSFVSVLFLVSTNRCSVLFLAQRSVVLAAARL